MPKQATDKEILDAYDLAIADMSKAIKSLQDLEEIHPYPGHISWITYTNGWEKYISLYQACTNLKSSKDGFLDRNKLKKGE